MLNETQAILMIMQICKCTAEEVYEFLARVGGADILQNKLEGKDQREALLALYNFCT